MNMQTQKQTNKVYSYCNTNWSGRINVMKYFLLLMETRHVPCFLSSENELNFTKIHILFLWSAFEGSYKQ